MPKVSIIIPNYNYEPFLKQRMETVLNQTLQDFELILLDDCSTDGSRALLQKYSQNEKVAHTVFNEANTGSPFMQWEKGLSLVKGEYVWIAESDDFAQPTFLEECVKALDEHPTASVAACWSQMVDQDGRSIDKGFDQIKHEGSTMVYGSEEYLKHNLFWGTSVYNASMAVFRYDCYAKIDKDYTNYRYCGDWLFWFEMVRQGDIILIHKKLNCFRQHNKRVTVTSEKAAGRIMELLEIRQHIWSTLKEETFRRWVSKGVIYKDVKRLHLDEETARQLFQVMKSRYHITAWHYTFERTIKTLSQFIPFITNPSKDSLK